jgi:(4S)-4-hydroxy-5-phosphonooxypentane-2,3-dione isomerase
MVAVLRPAADVRRGFQPKEPSPMYVVCVHIHVKPEHVQSFIDATLDNARHTIQEPGNLRFDVLRQADDPHRFLLYEVYRDEGGMQSHKETAHYARWQAAVGPWMAEPRKGVKHASLFPDDEVQWRARRQG